MGRGSGAEHEQEGGAKRPQVSEGAGINPVHRIASHEGCPAYAGRRLRWVGVAARSTSRRAAQNAPRSAKARRENRAARCRRCQNTA